MIGIGQQWSSPAHTAGHTRRHSLGAEKMIGLIFTNEKNISSDAIHEIMAHHMDYGKYNKTHYEVRKQPDYTAHPIFKTLEQKHERLKNLQFTLTNDAAIQNNQDSLPALFYTEKQGVFESFMKYNPNGYFASYTTTDFCEDIKTLDFDNIPLVDYDDEQGKMYYFSPKGVMFEVEPKIDFLSVLANEFMHNSYVDADKPVYLKQIVLSEYQTI